MAYSINAQSLAELLRAQNSSDSAIQAIHSYPADIKDGECHNVPVTSLSLVGNKITITETWTNFRKGESKTVLTGTLLGTKASGTWKSSFSKGNWGYNFATGIGRWNKTNAPLRFGTFDIYQPLRFRIVKKKELKDGFIPCH